MKPKLIAIVGPTASGKSSLALAIAKHIGGFVRHSFSDGGEVISIDSRQVYRGMDVGTAKVRPDVIDSSQPVEGPRSIKELFSEKPYVVEGINHWGLDLVDPDVDYSIAEFKVYADKKIAEIVHRKHVPILVGGTGFWLQAIINNYDLTNTKSDQVLRDELEARTLGDLFYEYNQLDPEGAEMIDRDNKRKLVRALEVTKLTGIPFSQAQTKGESLYDVLQIGLSVDRDELNERINLRVDEMVAGGLVDEVREMKDRYGCAVESMTGIGYRQVCDFLEKKTSLKEAIEAIKTASRQYAKRQMTWFKRDDRIVWVTSNEKAIELVDRFVGAFRR